MPTSLHEEPAITPPKLATARCTLLVGDGKHNAFPVICRWRDQYWIAYRSGVSHASGPAAIVVLRSHDTRTWTQAFEIKHGMDNRDPQFLPDGDRLLVFWCTQAAGQPLRSYVAVTTDGQTIGPARQVHQDDFITWRPIRHAGRYYSASYRRGSSEQRQLDLIQSDDGLSWRHASTLGSPPGRWSETVIDIDAAGVMSAWLRFKHAASQTDHTASHAQRWTARFPYHDWQLADTLPFRIEGPSLDCVGGEKWLLTRAFNALGSAAALNIHRLCDHRPVLYCSIPCMRDSAYGQAVEHAGQMLIVFYCTAPDGVNLYLARLPLPQA